MSKDKLTWGDSLDNGSLNRWRLKSINCPCRIDGDGRSLCKATINFCEYSICPFLFWDREAFGGIS